MVIFPQHLEGPAQVRRLVRLITDVERVRAAITPALQTLREVNKREVELFVEAFSNVKGLSNNGQ